MAKYSVTITERRQLTGIAVARDEYNKAAAIEAETEGKGFIPLTDAQYIQFVMERAAESYANQYKVD